MRVDAKLDLHTVDLEHEKAGYDSRYHGSVRFVIADDTVPEDLWVEATVAAELWFRFGCPRQLAIVIEVEE